ncbi:hypothetical protein [uncultured Amnibacterium sp.]|uniref:hypothetical protein n=1 Tax=uncultured Amnibacterium sp. TaxID=1631851 RepID=UPI0035CA8240
MTTTIDRPSSASTSGVSFGRVLHAEWLKLVTVRSTYWTTAISVALAALVVVLVGANVHPQPGSTADPALLLTATTPSLAFVALIVGVLGVLSIGGEYATLQIRSSYTAVPRRLPALLAKAIVVGAWSFVLGLVLTFGGFGIIALFFGGDGAAVSLGGGVLGGLVGGALHLAVVAVFAVGLGALVRSSAAGISILTALLFVAPVILGLLGALLRAEWITTVTELLLATAGGDLSAAPGAAGLDLWAAALALVGWVLVVWIPALVLTAVRDV